MLREAGITTTAQDGNGGAITINGGRIMWFTNSQILTSVLGLSGNGGDITVGADTLILETGFIQANTAAEGASGGRVTVNVNTLIPSGSSLLLGGQTPVTFRTGAVGLNVIQAAAPDGVAGAIVVTNPQLDLAGSLVELSAAIVDTTLTRDLCGIGAGSSFVPVGRGGLAPAAGDLLRAEQPPVPRDMRSSRQALGAGPVMGPQPAPLRLAGCM